MFTYKMHVTYHSAFYQHLSLTLSPPQKYFLHLYDNIYIRILFNKVKSHK